MHSTIINGVKSVFKKNQIKFMFQLKKGGIAPKILYISKSSNFNVAKRIH